MGRDLAFSPDGNTIAVFAKRERGRSLLLLDVLNGGIRDDHRHGRASSSSSPRPSRPDGRKVAFSGWRNGQFDIFLLDLETRDDHQPHQRRALRRRARPSRRTAGRWSSSPRSGGGYAKLFRIDLDKPGGAAPAHRRRVERERPGLLARRQADLLHLGPRGAARTSTASTSRPGSSSQYTNVVTGAFMADRAARARTARSGWSSPASGRGASTSTSPTSTSRSRRPRRSQCRPAPAERQEPAALRARHPGHPRRRQQGQVPRAQVLPRGRPDLHRRRRQPDLPRPRRSSASPTTWATGGSSPTSARSTASRTSTSSTPTSAPALAVAGRSCSTTGPSTSPSDPMPDRIDGAAARSTSRPAPSARSSIRSPSTTAPSSGPATSSARSTQSSSRTRTASGRP